MSVSEARWARANVRTCSWAKGDVLAQLAVDLPAAETAVPGDLGVDPAETLRSSPVIAAAAGEPRKTAAAVTSAGSMSRAGGEAEVNRARASAGEMSSDRACASITASMRGPSTAPGRAG
jgi:hypothetical protein